MVKIETDDVMESAKPHLHELVALQTGVEMFRDELGDAFDGFSDFELMNLIRAAYGDEPAGSDIAARIEADRVAIKRALTAGAMNFAQRLTASNRH